MAATIFFTTIQFYAYIINTGYPKTTSLPVISILPIDYGAIGQLSYFT